MNILGGGISRVVVVDQPTPRQKRIHFNPSYSENRFFIADSIAPIAANEATIANGFVAFKISLLI